MKPIPLPRRIRRSTISSIRHPIRRYGPFRPTVRREPRALITVDAGRFQIESDFLNYSSTNRQGASTSTFEATDPVVKLGINSFTDFEVGFAGFVDTRTTQNLDGTTLSKGSGFGDVTLATKFNLLGNAGGTYGFALIPYLIVPSGTRNVSSGGVEGGVIAPFTVSLPSDFNLTLQTEVDALRNSDNPGTHVAFTNIINVTHPVPGIKDLTATVELYSSVLTERHTPDIYTFDTALAYLVQPDLQLDIGANIGLNHGAPDYPGLQRGRAPVLTPRRGRSADRDRQRRQDEPAEPRRPSDTAPARGGCRPHRPAVARRP